MNNTEIRYELFTGFKKDDSLSNLHIAGAAFYEEDHKYYRLKLMMFPGQTYYMVKNRDSLDKYTVYSKVLKDQDGRSESLRFQNPVGTGYLDPKLHSHLEVSFPILRGALFMSLFQKT